MKSGLEIAQEATLRPIIDVAAELGLEAEEVEPPGRYRAKVSLGVLERQFVVALCGDMQRMPGLGRTPAFMNVDIDEQARTVDLF